jgi:hypothetical protein
MALTFDQTHQTGRRQRTPPNASLGLGYAWSGFAVMWAFWVSFVIFLAQPTALIGRWPLPMVDVGGAVEQSLVAAIIDSCLIALFGLQHSVMARPAFKTWWAGSIPPAFERCTYVHMANVALFTLIIFWQPIPSMVWNVEGPLEQVLWVLFGLGWLMLFAGGWSFGIFDLLGVTAMRAWARGDEPKRRQLKTGKLYNWMPHPMYVGVLLGVWATPRMSLGHLLLAGGLTLYVLIAMRYEERDLARRYGQAYRRWRTGDRVPGTALDITR